MLASFGVLSGRTPVGVVNKGASVFYDPFGSYAFNRNELVAMATAVVAVAALGALFRFTALGLRMRAEPVDSGAYAHHEDPHSYVWTAPGGRNRQGGALDGLGPTAPRPWRLGVH